ncbi:MAG: HEAT repeat domain-containing protein [Candidatus Acidiferrales bacterium]
MSDKQQDTPQGMPQSGGPVRCEDIESLAVLYACDELDAGARAELDAHIAACPACAAVVSREARLQQAVASLEQPADSLDRSGLLLAQCRSQLAESLDDRQARASRSVWRSIFFPVAWWGALRHTLIYHPAMSMTFLVVAGFLAGVAGQRLRVVPTQAVSPRPVMTVSATPKVTDQQLQSAGSAHVAWVTPSGSRTPTVQVQLMSQTPMNIVGAPDDADVERALTFVLENSQRFDPDARLDSLDVLRTRAADPSVRRSLCAAARLDRNPGVRMKAIEALQGFEQDPAVRQTLLDALKSDDNSGVRVEAINLLVGALQSNDGSAAPDPQTLDVLRDRLRNDPNNYVRLQSAAALRELGEQ